MIIAVEVTFAFLRCTTINIRSMMTNANSPGLRSAQSSVRDHIRSAAPVIALIALSEADSFLPATSTSTPDIGPSAAKTSTDTPLRFCRRLRRYCDSCNLPEYRSMTTPLVATAPDCPRQPPSGRCASTAARKPPARPWQPSQITCLAASVPETGSRSAWQSSQMWTTVGRFPFTFSSSRSECCAASNAVTCGECRDNL
jgi:hypothetical protein